MTRLIIRHLRQFAQVGRRHVWFKSTPEHKLSLNRSDYGKQRAATLLAWVAQTGCCLSIAARGYGLLLLVAICRGVGGLTSRGFVSSSPALQLHHDHLKGLVAGVFRQMETGRIPPRLAGF
jgi:hypothetical protein